jgi:hypothetical protein
MTLVPGVAAAVVAVVALTERRAAAYEVAESWGPGRLLSNELVPEIGLTFCSAACAVAELSASGCRWGSGQGRLRRGRGHVAGQPA